MTLVPNGAWGGEGSIGAGIGYGYLHRIPTRDDEEAQLNGVCNGEQHSTAPGPAAAAEKGAKDGFSEVLTMDR